MCRHYGEEQRLMAKRVNRTSENERISFPVLGCGVVGLIGG